LKGDISEGFDGAFGVSFVFPGARLMVQGVVVGDVGGGDGGTEQPKHMKSNVIISNLFHLANCLVKVCQQTGWKEREREERDGLT
jgi:hypothetical protein